MVAYCDSKNVAEKLTFYSCPSPFCAVLPSVGCAPVVSPLLGNKELPEQGDNPVQASSPRSLGKQSDSCSPVIPGTMAPWIGRSQIISGTSSRSSADPSASLGPRKTRRGAHRTRRL
ncbi:hypothetical protein NDU88_000130 [Pleurodeles waltl]|uniref:Uncharacterized protein n=1 Tax=Pleurodeles waltl TaxID=8319 RepID=A0AAV7KN55_PLEWA|nr:hypothetical protein NDU88_000130 [Pleurodeles waltl]